MPSTDPNANSNSDTARVTGLETLLVWLLVLGIAGSVLLSLASLRLSALADDEAWILEGVAGLVDRGEYSRLTGSGAATTGGLYTVVQSLVYALAGRSPTALRLFPFACMLGLGILVFGWARRTFASVPAALLAVCVPIAIPGTLTLGGSGFGAVPALLLAVAGIWCWDPGRASAKPRAIATGIAFGLAAATRPNCLVLFPALVLVSAFAYDRMQRVRPVIIACGVGIALYVLATAALVSMMPDALDETTAKASASIGLDNWMPRPVGLLSVFVIGNGFLPVWVMATATCVGFFGLRAWMPNAQRPQLLLVFAWLLWGSWLWFAPMPHLRYVWPALAAFALVLGVGLAALYAWAHTRERANARLAALLIGAACLGTGGLSTARGVAVADLNTLLWEWREVLPVRKWIRPLERGDQQRRMAAYLATFADEEIVALSFGAEFEFLTGRPIPRLLSYMGDDGWKEPPPKLLLVTSHVGQRRHVSARGLLWFEEETEREARFGLYSLYRVTGAYPEHPSILETPLQAPRPR